MPIIHFTPFMPSFGVLEILSTSTGLSKGFDIFLVPKYVTYILEPTFIPYTLSLYSMYAKFGAPEILSLTRAPSVCTDKFLVGLIFRNFWYPASGHSMEKW